MALLSQKIGSEDIFVHISEVERAGHSTLSNNTSDSFTVASTCNNEENSFLISVTKLSNGRNNKRYYARNDQCK
jgi:cold shock CspA family protein